jgi:hypothetical protein
MDRERLRETATGRTGNDLAEEIRRIALARDVAAVGPLTRKCRPAIDMPPLAQRWHAVCRGKLR